MKARGVTTPARMGHDRIQHKSAIATRGLQMRWSENGLSKWVQEKHRLVCAHVQSRGELAREWEWEGDVQGGHLLLTARCALSFQAPCWPSQRRIRHWCTTHLLGETQPTARRLEDHAEFDTLLVIRLRQRARVHADGMVRSVHYQCIVVCASEPWSSWRAWAVSRVHGVVICKQAVTQGSTAAMEFTSPDHTA
jgi:hypothetical protein